MDLETVAGIVSLLREHPISEIIVEREGLRVVARKPLAPRSHVSAYPSPEDAAVDASAALTDAAAVQELVAESTPVPEPLMLTAGMVGLFRHAEPPLGYGAHVTAGQIVGSIEAMKVLNDARAESGGQVVDVFVEEGAPVEYGQPLFRLMPL